MGIIANEDDFVGYEWLQPTELLARLATSVPAKEMKEDAELVSAYLREHKTN